MHRFWKILIVAAVAAASLATLAADPAASHGFRHGKGKPKAWLMKHPAALKQPGWGCYHEDWGTTKNQTAVIYDDDLGWLIIWRCVCVEDPDTVGTHEDCQWKIWEIIPSNVSNARILRELPKGKNWTKPRLRIMAGGHVFRRHAPGSYCHWHNPKNQPAIIVRWRPR